eukprot:TRINITY_DN12732_c0_g1_i1.p1 TRINITY_DN12732_c0_g1~~TRINITY_DN12732_c0_g1_i1.p1  ORF type:complete len:346 (+),score=110.49 TRINITY_DN12732_c0_g1_i1:47-1084(+)
MENDNNNVPENNGNNVNNDDKIGEFSNIGKGKDLMSILLRIEKNQKTPGGFTKNPSESEEILHHFTPDLHYCAQQVFQFLDRVDTIKRKGLKDRDNLKHLCKTYIQFIILQREYLDKGEEMLMAPIEIELIWQSHLIRNYAYAQFCKHFFNKKLVDHCVKKMLVPENHKEQVERTKKAWEEKYGFELKFENEWLRTDQSGEEYIVHVSQDSGNKELDEYVSELLEAFTSVVSVDDLCSDIEWQHKVAATHFKKREDLFDEPLYKKYFKNYEKFLYICAKYPSRIVGLGAAHDVDLFWHTHMMHPIDYDKDTEKLVPVELFHNPLIDGNDKGTDQLWRMEFGVSPY